MIFLAKLLIFLKRLIAAFFVKAINGPGRWLLRFVFYRVLVKFYKFYLYIIKKTGWKSLEEKSLIALINQKSVHFIVVAITIILVFTNLTSKTKAESLSDKASNTIISSLIESEFGSLEENKLIEEFFDEEAVISSTQQNYLDNLVSVKAEPSVNVDAYGEKSAGEINILTQGTGAMIKPEVASTKKTKRPRGGIFDYIVKTGDTISTIAAEFEISVSSILWENNLSSYSVIRPGDKLAILPFSGVSHAIQSGETLSSIAKKYEVEESAIIESNKLTDSSKIAVGQKLLVPGGSKSGYGKAARPARYSGIAAIKDLVKSPNAMPASGNAMNWPTQGHRITQYYSWRHHGLDIANKVGTPIYSADAGKIEYVGWGKGYGNQIVVDHGGGKKTRYAHLSKFYVKQGQAVDKGETIGAMGSTGWSTGPHLHFEVIINGGKYNPLNYIK